MISTSPPVEGRSQWEMIRTQFFRHKLGVLGAVVVCLLGVTALFADFISPYYLTTQHKEYSFAPPSDIHLFTEDGRLTRPFIYDVTRGRDPETWTLHYMEDKSERYPIYFLVRGDTYEFLGLFETNLHLFGTGTREAPLFLFGADQYGRDLFTRILWGGRVSLSVGPLGILISFFLGIFFGGISGYWGGRFDLLMQRFTEVIMSFPQLPLWLTLTTVFPDTWSSAVTYIAMVGVLAFVNWALVARVIRGQFLSLRENDFVTAARASGCSDLRVIFRHILPNVSSYLIVAATISIPGYILGESTLSFLGLGIREPMASWGLLLDDAQSLNALQMHSWLMIPGLFIVVAVLAFNFMGDALRDAVDPFAES